MVLVVVVILILRMTRPKLVPMKTQLSVGPNNFGGVNTNDDVDEVKNNGDRDDADGGKGISRIFLGIPFCAGLMTSTTP